jgi:hypothetical protein
MQCLPQCHRSSCYRAYAIDVATDLFGAWLVDMSYGRIGTIGRSKIRSFATIEDAQDQVHADAGGGEAVSVAAAAPMNSEVSEPRTRLQEPPYVEAAMRRLPARHPCRSGVL